MSIAISSMSGSRSVDLTGSVISTMGGGGERMQLIEWSVGLGGKRAPKTNEMLLQHLPEYVEVSRILPLANIFPTLFQVRTLW